MKPVDKEEQTADGEEHEKDILQPLEKWHGCCELEKYFQNTEKFKEMLENVQKRLEKRLEGKEKPKLKTLISELTNCSIYDDL